VVRTVFLLVVEVVLAITDFFRGVFDGKHFNKELKFIPTRVAICILLRELSTAGVLMDVARGVPVVHVNFIGYDEQAHRRGPTSRFAHWSLKGIDHALRRIWGAAHRSKWRSYDMWIYSDHGQEESVPYEVRHGRPLARALEEWVGEYGEPAVVRNGEKAGHLLRARLLGGRRLQRLLPVHSEFESPPEGKAVRVAHMGPLGHVYWPQPLESEEKERLARRLVDLVKIPLVLTPDGPDRAAAWTEAGRFSLPREAASVLGAGHPFLSEAAEELVRVTHHADAGTFVISGWSPTEKMLNLAVENGSHGGPGTQELEAFALLPVDTPLTSRDGPHVRALDLREAALRHLGRAPKHRHVPGPRAAVRAFRLMSYNVHSCLGMDGVYSPERIARVIARHEPDVVCLQELDMSRPRSGNVDQAALIAQEVRMLWHFHAALHLAEGRYGNAILSPHPMRLVKAGHLPRDPLGRDRETRGALWAAIRFGEVEVQVLNTHLGLFGLERAKQVEALLGSQWTAHPDFREPAVLSGDFNITPRSGSYKIITKTWRDSQLALKGHRPRGTWFGRYPFQRIDYAFVSPSVEVVSVVVPHSHLERVASDHLPLLTELRVHP
jgi:endonuclease/exonuclease/phosphatase family metal-dependent hydrolase